MIPQERFPGRITLYITKQCMRARKKEPKYDQLFYHLESLKWMRLYGVTLNPWQFTPVTLTIKMPAIIKWDIWIARLRGLGFPEDGCNIQTPTMNPPSLPPLTTFPPMCRSAGGSQHDTWETPLPLSLPRTAVTHGSVSAGFLSLSCRHLLSGSLAVGWTASNNSAVMWEQCC